MTATAAQIWKKLTPSQRVTLLNELNLSYYGYGDAALLRAGLKKRGHLLAALTSGAARHALGRKGLLDVGQTIAAPTTAAGFHTPRKVTALGRTVAEHGVALLRGPLPPAPPLTTAALATGYQPETEEGGRTMMQAITPAHLRQAEAARKLRSLKPGDEIEYTNFTVGGSYKGKAVVTWDHGKSVEARTLPAGEKVRLERASDGSLRRFT